MKFGGGKSHYPFRWDPWKGEWFPVDRVALRRDLHEDILPTHPQARLRSCQECCLSVSVSFLKRYSTFSPTYLKRWYVGWTSSPYQPPSFSFTDPCNNLFEKEKGLPWHKIEAADMLISNYLFSLYNILCSSLLCEKMNWNMWWVSWRKVSTCT